MGKYSDYDYKTAFEKDLGPELQKIQVYCIQHKIPFYMMFATASKETVTNYYVQKRFPDEYPECSLKDDRFRVIGLKLMGFDVTLNHQDVFDFESVDMPD